MIETVDTEVLDIDTRIRIPVFVPNIEPLTESSLKEDFLGTIPFLISLLDQLCDVCLLLFYMVVRILIDLLGLSFPAK